MRQHAVFLGACGLLPFLLLPLATETKFIALFEGVSYFLQYAAVILSFLGGVLWYTALTNHNPVYQIYIAMLPSILAWLSLMFLPYDMVLLTLSAGFVVLLVYEQRIINAPEWYQRLRLVLTSVVVGCHLMMNWQL